MLPPPQLEEAALQEMVRHTLSNTQSKAYKHLVASCFQQQMTVSEDIVYDMDMSSSAGLHQSAWIFQVVQEVFIKHCQRRGAICFKVTVFFILKKCLPTFLVCILFLLADSSTSSESRKSVKTTRIFASSFNESRR